MKTKLKILALDTCSYLTELKVAEQKQMQGGDAATQILFFGPGGVFFQYYRFG